MSEPGIVYVIRAHDSDRVKIGYSKSEGGAQRRLEGFRTGSPQRLSLIAMWPGFKREETAFHRALYRWQLHDGPHDRKAGRGAGREWFVIHRAHNLKLTDGEPAHRVLRRLTTLFDEVPEFDMLPPLLDARLFTHLQGELLDDWHDYIQGQVHAKTDRAFRIGQVGWPRPTPRLLK